MPSPRLSRSRPVADLGVCALNWELGCLDSKCLPRLAPNVPQRARERKAPLSFAHQSSCTSIGLEHRSRIKTCLRNDSLTSPCVSPRAFRCLGEAKKAGTGEETLVVAKAAQDVPITEASPNSTWFSETLCLKHFQTGMGLHMLGWSAF